MLAVKLKKLLSRPKGNLLNLVFASVSETVIKISVPGEELGVHSACPTVERLEEWQVFEKPKTRDCMHHQDCLWICRANIALQNGGNLIIGKSKERGPRGSQVVQCWRTHLSMQETQETQVWSLDWEDPMAGRRRKWQLTPVFLAGKFHGQRSLSDYSLWGHIELDTFRDGGAW